MEIADPHLPADADPEPHTGDLDVSRLFELTGDLLAAISREGRFTLLNTAWTHALGWSREELMEHPVSALIHPEDAAGALAPILAGSGPSHFDGLTTRFLHRDGTWRALRWSARREGARWYAVAQDMTDRMRLERQALHDPLTQLPNRLLLMDRARQALARVHRGKGVVAMLFVDLDKFKAVNDSLGHDRGDQVLVAMADRLTELLRDSDTVARLGGDEFVILAEELEGEEEALALGARVIDALEEPVRVRNAEVALLASVGISVARDAELDPEAMLHEADLAMYRAKRAGGRRLEVFDESLRQQVSTSIALEGMLREAVPRRELWIAYQPIVSLTSGVAVGCEALVRWHPPQGAEGPDGDLLPASFLPTAEDSDLIVQIGNWVLHTACAQAEAWRRRGVQVPISVNVSARELTELDLAERVREELAYCRLPGRALTIEVSEDAVLRDPGRARDALREVKRLGVSIALDKFGSGERSLGLPRDLPVDVLKLDPSLIASADHDKAGRALFAAAVALAAQSGLTAIAVGIETDRQLALARELDCSVGQGFLIQGPTSADRVRLRELSRSVGSAPWRPRVRLSGHNR